MKVSVAVPAYNSSKILRANIMPFAEDERVSEIVVRDDGSPDFAALKLSLADVPKVRLLRNIVNVGPYANKAMVIADCREKWAVLWDHDNKPDEGYLNIVDKPLNDRVIYCPDFARPCFDYRKFDDTFITRDLVAERLRDSGILGTLLNTGNYLVPVERFGPCASAVLQHRPAMDTMMRAYHWLKDDNVFYVVPEMTYWHSMPAGSWAHVAQAQIGTEYAALKARMLEEWR